MNSSENRRSWFTLLAVLLCVYALVGAVISFLGWALDMPRLADWEGSGIAIQPNSTVGAFLTALSVLLILRGKHRIALLTGLITFAIGVTTLFQIATDINLGINTLFMFGREWGRTGILVPGRMGVPGGTSWTLLGAAVSLIAIERSGLVSSRIARLEPVASVAVSLAIFVSALSLTGYAFGAEILYALPRFTVIALQNATFIFALSVALLLQMWGSFPMRAFNEDTSTGRLLRNAVPAVLILPALLGLLQLAGERGGLYDRAFGIALATLSEIILLLFILFWTARSGAENEARKMAMFETALDCIVSIDEQGNVTEFNPAAEETFGHSRKEVIGRSLPELIMPPQAREAHRRGLAHYLATGEGPILNKRIEVTAMRSDGTEFPVELTITRVGRGSKPEFIGFIRDITERKEAELTMKRINEELEHRVVKRTSELNESVTALARSNAELEQFASVASHDLQEPLRKIQAFGDRLVKKYADELGAQGRTYVERMDYSATRMRSLIDSLLTFSRVTSKGEPFVAVNLQKIADDVIIDLEVRIMTSSGRVEVGDLPTIQADPLQMTQLFQNLISNGLKFHRDGVPPVVTITTRVDEKNCELSFTDNGIGFELRYIDRIFEVFQRLHGRQEYEGTGIGLAICRKIVERHGGTITAESVPGSGSTFLVTLPIIQT